MTWPMPKEDANDSFALFHTKTACKKNRYPMNVTNKQDYVKYIDVIDQGVSTLHQRNQLRGVSSVQNNAASALSAADSHVRKQYRMIFGRKLEPSPEKSSQ